MHIFAGKGIPNIRTQEKNRVAKVPARIVLNPDEAISRYHAMGGQLTLVPVFGADPLSPSHKILLQQLYMYVSVYNTNKGLIVIRKQK